ncbi:MAG: PKD domain-containing protein [Flavobacteriales bacterium]
MRNQLTKKHLALACGWIICTLFSSGQIDPTDLPGLTFWLRADSAVLLSGVDVTTWEDLSGGGHHASQPAAVVRPDFMPDAINGLPAVSFDGTDDFMSFPEVNDLRTVFWVVRENQLANPNWPRRSLLGHSSTMFFLRGDQRRLWDSFAGAMVVQGNTRLNFNPVNGTTTPLPAGFNLVSIVTTANAAATHLTMDLNVFGRTWWGEIAEIIGFSQPLSSAEVLVMETYLANKYTPDFIPIPDVIVPYGFCDTLLCAPEGMASYLWSNGSADPCISIDSEGTFTLQVTDAFGRSFFDSFTVSYPGLTQVADTTICSNQLFVWDTGLPAEGYSFQWNGTPGGPVFSSGMESQVQLTITDALGCSESDSFSLAVDGFPDAGLLDSEYAICSGTLLIPEVPPGGGSILWSDGSSGPSFQVLENGVISALVLNGNGCALADTATVTILGVAPVVNVQSGPACAGLEMAFAATSNVPVNNWTWDTGNGPWPGNSTYTAVFDAPGEYHVVVTGWSENGCAGNFILPVSVTSPPQADASFSLPCEDVAVLFESSTTGEIGQWIWSINGSGYTGESVEVSFSESGSIPVSLLVQDAAGCTDVLVLEVFVLPAPAVEIEASDLCFGELTGFQSEIIPNGAGSIIGGHWDFGDGSTSPLEDPVYFYSSPGSYEVTFTVQGSNGCSVSESMLLQISLPPEVDFVTGSACVGEPFALISEVVAQPGDPVVSYEWTVDGDLCATGPQGSVIFQENGFHSINLDVAAEGGCTASLEQQVVSWPAPHAAFTQEPFAGADLYSYAFSNLSQGIDLSFEWSFGDGGASEEENPVHRFSDRNLREVALVARTLQGCRDTASTALVPEPPQCDLAVVDARLSELTGGRVQVALDVRNQGNLAVPAIRGSWQGGGEIVLSEIWQQPLSPGESAALTFTSAVSSSDFALDYFCAEAYADDLPADDIRPADNVFCKALTDSGMEVYPPFPNPAADDVVLRWATRIESDLEIQVFSAGGNLVKLLRQPHLRAGFHQHTIHVADLAPGTYVVRVMSGGQERSVTFSRTAQ